MKMDIGEPINKVPDMINVIFQPFLINRGIPTEPLITVGHHYDIWSKSDFWSKSDRPFITLKSLRPILNVTMYCLYVLFICTTENEGEYYIDKPIIHISDFQSITQSSFSDFTYS